tara:strand:- start:6612 stop:6854 length:243 start_codon:yes stop_codon:yes gene_type:complete
MNRHVFLMALKSAVEPTSHLLMECGAILATDTEDSHVHRLIGQALDRWGITKEELLVRNRLAVNRLNDYLEREPALQANK